MWVSVRTIAAFCVVYLVVVALGCLAVWAAREAGWGGRMTIAYPLFLVAGAIASAATRVGHVVDPGRMVVPCLIGYFLGLPLVATAENLALPQDFRVLLIATATVMAPLGAGVVWFGAEMAGLLASSIRWR